MLKYRPELNNLEKSELKRLAEIDFSDYTEADVREEFIVPIMKILGYQKGKDFSISREESFNLNDAFISVGSKRVRLDYIFSIRKKYFWLIDAKAGKRQSKEIQKEDVYQAYFYAIHPEVNCMFFGVCNGWKFNIYDRDNLDNDLTPLLSVNSYEIAERFMEIDKYIGSTQILPTLKKRLLSDIEKVLSAEVVLDRLDEFKTQVGYSLNRVRPEVLENFRENSRKIKAQEKDYRTQYLQSLSAWQIVETLFVVSKTMNEIVDATKYVFESSDFKNYESRHYLLMHRLLLNEPRPVNSWYFVNIIHFLIYLLKNDVATIKYDINGCAETKVIDHLNFWIKEVFSRFENRKEFRLLTIFSGEMRRYLKIMFLMSRDQRLRINQVVLGERYYIPEENLSAVVTCEARTMLNTMERVVDEAMSHFIDRFYNSDSRKFNIQLATDEVMAIRTANDNYMAKNKDRYQEIKKELGSSWSELTWTESNYRTFDPIISAVGAILKSNESIYHQLDECVKEQIAIVSCLGLSQHTSKFIDTSNVKCKDLDDNMKMELIDEFFSVSYEPSSMRKFFDFT